MSFEQQKAETFQGDSLPKPPPGLCHGLTGQFTASPDPQLLSTVSVFHAHIIWAPLVLPISTFFFHNKRIPCVFFYFVSDSLLFQFL